MESIQVLLSTYNGEKYIHEQLESILTQEHVKIQCLIRDDGSTDNTLGILAEYEKQNENIEVIIGKNLGYGLSFLELVQRSGDYKYYAFSDQDDVWRPEKLVKAIEKIKANEKAIPTMYCSNCTIVDDDLNQIGTLHSSSDVIPQKKVTSLTQGFAQGCTMLFNEKSRRMIQKYRPEQSYAHDFWIPLLHVFLGKVIYDQNSYMLYRQHATNVFGGQRSFLKLVKIKLGFLKHRRDYYSQMAKDLLSGYGDLLNTIDYHQLEKIATYKSSLLNRIRLFFNKDIKRNTIRGTIILKILILFSRF